MASVFETGNLQIRLFSESAETFELKVSFFGLIPGPINSPVWAWDNLIISSGK